MKTKFSKKLISLLLSLLMVVSALPMSAITASAAISATYQKHLLYGSASDVNVVNGAVWRDSESALEISAGSGSGADGKYANINITELFKNTTKSQGFTISFRAKSDSNPNANSRYITISQKYNTRSAMDWNNTGDKSPRNNAYIDLFASNNKVEICSSRNSPDDLQTASATGYAGAYHIFTIVVVNNTVKVYVDGKASTSINSSNDSCFTNFFNQMATSANLLIGGTPWPDSGQFSGYIGQVNLYNKALTADEVATDVADINKNYNEYNKKVTAFSGNLANNGTGLTISGSESRWSNNQMNIVNDQEANNTDAGIIRYDISKLKGMTVESAKLNYKIDSWSADTVTTGLTFYYSTSISNASYINNGETKSTGWSCGSGTTANNSFATGLGFSTSNTLGVVSKGSATSTTQMDIQSALQKAADAGASYLYVIIMQSTAGGKGSNSGWSDTKISPANFTIDYSAKYKEYTRTDVANIKKNLTDTKLNNAPYKGTMERTEDGSYSKSTLVGGDEMSNVLYSYGVGGSSGYSRTEDKNYFRSGIQYGNVTLLYDGVNEMSFPVTYFIERTKPSVGSTYPQRPFSTYLTSDYAECRHIWHGYSESSGYQTSTEYTVNYVNSNSGLNWHTIRAASVVDYYSNTIYIKNADSMPFENNRYKFNTNWKIYVQDNNGKTNYTRDLSVDNDSQKIRVINYKPIYDAIIKGKEIYNTVKDNEMAYCPTDLYNFYNALDKLCSFNPNNYFAYNNNGYEACCNAMDALEPYIDVAKTTPITSDWSYTHSYTDGQTNSAVKHSMVCSKCGEEVEENCTWNAGVVTTEATCTSTGVKTYTCTKCSGTVTETIEKKEHNWGAWTTTTEPTCQAEGQKKRVCSVCKAEETDTIAKLEHNYTTYKDLNDSKNHYIYCTDGGEYWKSEAHDSNEVIPGTPATCTETGLTDGAKCSKCGRVMVAQTVIPASGHDYGEDFVCKHNCGTSIDISAFTAAVANAQAKLAETDKYTAKSLATLKAVVDSTTITPNVDNQDAVNDKAGIIITAINALVLDSFSATLYIVNYDTKDTIGTKTYSGIRYGTSVNFDASELIPANSYINKWVASDTEKDSLINSSSTKVSYVIYDNTTIYCYVTQKADDTQTKVKVTLIDKSNHVTGIAYVASGSTFSKNGNELTVGGAILTAPKYPYYQIKEFRLADANTIVTENGYQVTSDIVVTPVYAAEPQIEITTTADDVTINGQVRSSYTAKWDQTITVYNENATAWYADGILVATGNKYKFQATQSVEITYDTATVTEGKSRIDYAKYESEFGYSRIVVSNCVPAGATIIEQGIKILTSSKENVPSVASSKVIAGTKKFVANKTTDTGLQFMFTLSTDDAVKTIAVVSFVTYELNGEAKTVWSSEGDASATMIYKTNA